MAIASTVKMYNTKTGTMATVSAAAAKSYEAKGYTTSVPTTDDKDKLVASAAKGVQSYYSKDTGVTTKKPTTTTTTKSAIGYDPVYTPTTATADTTFSAEDAAKIKAAQDKYAAATTQSEKDAAHAEAEAVRAGYGLTGGVDGSTLSKLATTTTTTPTTGTGTTPTTGTGTTPTTGTGTTPTTGTGFTDNSALIQKSAAETLKAAIAQINATKDQSNSEYQGQIDAAPQTYQPQRDAVDVATTRNLQTQNETAAAKGLTFSGGVQSDAGATYASGDTQKTALTAQEINLVNSLKKAIADNNKSAGYQIASTTAQSNAEQAQALISEQNRLDAAKYQSAQDTINNNLNAANLTGSYNGTDTLAKQSLDASNSQFDKSLASSTDQFNKSLASSTDQFNQTMSYQKLRDSAADAQWLKQFNESIRQSDIANGQWMQSFEADQANAAAGRAIQWAGVTLDQKKLEMSKADAVAAFSADRSALVSSIFSKAWDMMSQTTDVVDPNTGYIIQKPTNSIEDVDALITSYPGLTDEERNALYDSLRIPD